MNYQTAGKFMDVYYGRFLANGNCGYVLKPSYLRPDNTEIIAASPTIPTSRLSANLYSSNTPQILHIKVCQQKIVNRQSSKISSFLLFRLDNKCYSSSTT